MRFTGIGLSDLSLAKRAKFDWHEASRAFHRVSEICVGRGQRYLLMLLNCNTVVSVRLDMYLLEKHQWRDSLINSQPPKFDFWT